MFATFLVTIHGYSKQFLYYAAILILNICVSLSLPTTVLLTYLIQRFLVNAKKDELDRNNKHVQDILTAVSELSDNLAVAGSALSQISGNETASAKELASNINEMVDNNANDMADMTKQVTMINSMVNEINKLLN